jgi:parvulin-like peptidyl-prolyl isomerase
MAVAWGLKVGEFTRPIQSARGWHILKATDREGAHFTFFGARASVRNALVRRRIEGILEKLRAAAKIETYPQSQ